MLKNIIFANDHRGFEFKKKLIDHFAKKYKCFDVGCDSNLSVDFSDFVEKGAKLFKKKLDNTLLIVICGSSVGVSIVANRFKFIRCVAPLNNIEVLKSAKVHNNVNALALAADIISLKEAITLIKTLLATSFDDSSKRVNRVNKLSNIKC